MYDLLFSIMKIGNASWYKYKIRYRFCIWHDFINATKDVSSFITGNMIALYEHVVLLNLSISCSTYWLY